MSKLMSRMMQAQNESIEKVVPWFHKMMPQAYFLSTSLERRVWHLTAITSMLNGGLSDGGISKQSQEAFLWSPDGSELLFMTKGSSDHLDSLNSDFRELMRSSSSVPAVVEGPDGTKRPLARVNKFSALDSSFTMWTFGFGIETDNAPLRESAAVNVERALSYAQDQGADAAEMASLTHFCKEVASNEYLSMVRSPRRSRLLHQLYAQAAGTEDVLVHTEPWEGMIGRGGLAAGAAAVDIAVPGAAVTHAEHEHMMTVVVSNVFPKVVMSKVTDVLTRFGLGVNRVHLDVMGSGEDDRGGMARMALLRFQVANRSSEGAAAPDWAPITRELKRLKWCDNTVTTLLNRHHEIDMYTAEVLSALMNLQNARLGKSNPHLYTRSNILALVEHPVHWPIAVDIASLLQRRFDPDQTKWSAEEFESASASVRGLIHEKVQQGAQISEESATLLYSMLDAVGATLRTNLFVDDRYALSMRLAPTYMGVNETMRASDEEELPIPFGTFFIHGRGCDAFHVRFRDIARGGLRVVVPRGGGDQHENEAQRMHDEAYSLALAQQLKNKDIPEGGSKAVLLVRPGDNTKGDPHLLIRKSVKAFGDALLDLHSTAPETASRIVDWYGQDEQVYLGPDENIIPEDITWLIERAHVRGYPTPDAFMSSKPESGINHKVYGVTSTGVNVFLDVALRKSLRIDPSVEPFTVKMTGGTDGDVAGNCLRLLDQTYGSMARLVGICDGTATIEDEAGINMAELLRLVDSDLPLKAFNIDNAASSTEMVLADTPDGVARRNTMHMRVRADAFIPAGGRPNTINASNYSGFLGPKRPDGTYAPASGLIVEGANLFITPMARAALFDEGGVVIVKDSSANKCGVITSSYEIIASMLVSASEFIERKEGVVTEVQAKLRHLAREEAELLFREFKSAGGEVSLPDISNRVSVAIMRVHDALYASLSDRGTDPEFVLSDEGAAAMDIMTTYLPDALHDLGIGRLQDRVPVAYRRNIIASALASKLVYSEGLACIETIPDDALATFVERYMSSAARIAQLSSLVQTSGLPDASADDISRLLEAPGVTAAIALNPLTK